jgi:hypothetical protein
LLRYAVKRYDHSDVFRSDAQSKSIIPVRQFDIDIVAPPSEDVRDSSSNIHADVEILEQHFREKPEISGTAKKIAETLHVSEENITSMRLGGIVGHHEVIFGFPHQTVRLIHDSIRREAFGTGAAFALNELQSCAHGFYTFDDLLMRRVRKQIMESGNAPPS